MQNAKLYIYVYMHGGFPGGANGKESTSASDAGDMGHEFGPWVGKKQSNMTEAT